MLISHKYKFIFIKTAKTASTSIEVYLSQFLDESDIVTPFIYDEPNHTPRNHKGRIRVLSDLLEINGSSWLSLGNEAFRTLRDWRHNRLFYGHIPSWRIRARVGRKIWNNYYKFTVERNPWDKVISSYFYRKNLYGPDCLTLTDHIAFLANYKKSKCYGVGVAPFNLPLYSDKKHAFLVDKVMSWEQLETELEEVMKTIGIKGEFKGLSVAAKSKFRESSSLYQLHYTPAQCKQVEMLFEDEINVHEYRY